jgi:large subunit ribosomal protein L24
VSKLKIKKDDRVTVIAGRDKGMTGKVIKVMPEKQTALVEKVNMIKRHTKAGATKTGSGGIVEKEAPVHISNLRLTCPKCMEPTRVGRNVLEDGAKVRICKKCNEQIDA